MVAGFPIVKLGGLIIRQISKPLANIAKERAKNSHLFRTYFCMPPAQLYHWCDVRMKMYVMNIGKSSEKASIPKLNEQAAIELGANLLGEAVVFTVAVLVLGFEYNRQGNKEKAREQDERNFITSLENKIEDLEFQNEEMETKIRALERIVYALPQSKPKEKRIALRKLEPESILDTAVETVFLTYRN